MFGILGGLLGGGLLHGMGGGGGQTHGLPTTYGGRAPQAIPETPQPEQASGPTHAARAQEAPPQEPPQHPLAGLADKEVAQGQPVAMKAQQQRNPVHGLLDEAPPESPPPQAGEDKPPVPPSVENRTSAASPIAHQREEMLGAIPGLHQTDTLGNKLFDAGSNREIFQFQEGMPDVHMDTSSASQPSLGMQFMQSTTVGNSSPAPRYRSI